MNFWKYQGAGNDFILVDQRDHHWLSRGDTHRIAALCDRHFGIGADGLILLQQHPDHRFEMVYFNADGRESSMCGNGGRCFAAFLKHLGLIEKECHFLAVDGPHDAILEKPAGPDEEWVTLKMSPVSTIETTRAVDPQTSADAYILNTGSPHYVQFVGSVESLDMVQAGRAVRYSDAYKAEGINVNLVEEHNGQLTIRTYERGVEDETLACGTGVTAAALAYARQSGRHSGEQSIDVKALGGQLNVRFRAHSDGSFTDIWLSGPAKRVFSGSINL